MRRSDVILIHEMRGSVSDAVDVAYTALVVVVFVDVEIVVAIEGGALHASGQGFVAPFLALALGELFVVGCWAGTTDATGLVVVWREVGMAAAVERVGHVVWDAHVVEAVFFDGFVVEPGTVAGLPF